MNVKYDSEPKIFVDLRNKFPSIRDQGSRPLCLIFAASDLNAFSHAESNPFSVEYLSYYSYKAAGLKDYTQGLTCQAVTQALENHGQPHEYIVPYNKFAIKPYITSVVHSDLFYAKGNEKKYLMDEIIESLDNGYALTIGVNLNAAFFHPVGAHVIDDEVGSSANHALIVVGYGRYSDDEPCFLIRNSWGEAWANNGHAWLTSKFILNRAFMSLRLSKI